MARSSHCLLLALLFAGCSTRSSPPPPQPVPESPPLCLEEPSAPHVIDFVSPYDGAMLDYTLQEPATLTAESALILHLAATPEADLTCDHWVLTLPSRPGLAYQLVAEGELNAMFADALSREPRLKECSRYLLASPGFGSVALQLAAYQRLSVAAVAIYDASPALSLPNLDSFPIILIRGGEDDFWSQRYIDKLRRRGNSCCRSAESVYEALSLLPALASAAPNPPSYQFHDYHDNRAYPWLQVLGKREESESASISAQFHGERLTLHSRNVALLEVERASLPQPITSILFNDQLYLVPKESRNIVLGDEELGDFWRQKADTPARLLNFFRREPLLICYQDRDAAEEYLQRAHEVAERLSTLSFVGLSPSTVKLPLLPLSSYSPSDHDPHRLIAIGREKALRPLLESSPGYLPLSMRGNELYIGQEKVCSNLSLDECCYGLTYPPEKPSTLALALLLIAEDATGLETLSDEYLTATALFQPSDLRLWHSSTPHSTLAETTFDRYWSSETSHSFAKNRIAIPPQSYEAWEALLAELIIQETQQASLLTGKLCDPYLPPPQALSEGDLRRYVFNKPLAEVRFNKSTPPSVLKKLINGMEAPAARGLNPYIISRNPLRLDLNKLGNRRKQFIVELTALRQLNDTERATLEITLLPYTALELAEKRLQKDGRALAKELIRMENYR